MTFVFDPYGTQAQANDPYPVYRQLRDEHPAYYNPDRRFWALSRFVDVARAVHDVDLFSSAQGITILDRPDTPVQPMMIQMDPPRHTKLRSLVSRAFTPRRVTEMEPRIREITRGLLGTMADRGGGDLVGDLAEAVPSLVIAEILGVPPSDWPQFRRWSEDMVAVSPDPEDLQRNAEGTINLGIFFTEMLAERRAEPRDDIITALLNAEVERERLSDDELVWFCILLLIGGNGTTTNLISSGAMLLHQHPDQRAALAADPSLIPGAIEEMLPIEPPVQAMARTLTRDTTLHGETLREGDKVLIVYGAANHDDREFTDPDRFDITRRPDRHLAFGHGIHYCLGAALGRLEARIAFEELLALDPDYTVAETELTWNQLIPIRGLTSLELELRRGDPDATTGRPG